MQPFIERVELEPDEEVLLVVHKHWFSLLRDSIVPILSFVIPVGLYFLVRNSVAVNETVAKLPYKDAAVLFFISLWGLVTWMLIFLVWTDYYLDLWTITDRRIIAVDQRGLFRRVIASFRYERLQDVEVDINGFIATMLDFGDLHTQTAGHGDDFRINTVPDPRGIKALILRSADEFVPARHQKGDGTESKSEIDQ